MADLQQLFQLGQQVQGRLQQLQSELANRTIETTAGGGMVRVTADGRGTVRGLIDPAVFEGRRRIPRRSGDRRRREAQRRGRPAATEMRKVPTPPFVAG
jgi:hypothetical protein